MCNWRHPPVAPVITGPIRGHEICCNQSEFLVRLADIAGATGNVAPILTFHGLLFTYWRSQINGALDLASNDGAVECHLLLAGPVG